MKPVQTLIDQFRGNGMKATPQRVAICEYLHNNKTHPSADDIYSNLRPLYPTISLNTIYKTLDLLVKTGEIKRLTLNPHKNNYDPNTDTHHHIICNVCDKIIDIEHSFDSLIPLPGKLNKKYKINSFHIAFQGECEVCQAQNGRGAKPIRATAPALSKWDTM